MFNIFKKKDKESNYDLINQWTGYCHDLGLTQTQILGLAYFNSAIPTVLSFVNQNEEILSPLSKVVKDIGKTSSSEANALYLYREFHFNAKSRYTSILPIELENLPQDFFEGNNKYLNYIENNKGMLINSRLTVLLIQELGKILNDYNVDLKKAFELGHFHSNFFLNTLNGGLNYSQAIIMSNTLPHYIASAVEIIPFPNSLAVDKDLWLFSKILYPVLNDALNDSELREWIWYYHNSIFYEDKPGSTKIKEEWSITDPNFEINMLTKVMDTLPSYYKSNQKIGMQKRGIGPKFEKWEEFYPLLNSKMINEYEIQSPTTTFLNQGELCNYFAFKFIATIQTILEHSEF
jgi:hypothetical protein